MNEEICCITNERKMAKNLWALYSVYKKIRIIFFDTLLAIHHSVASYKYLEKLTSMKTCTYVCMYVFHHHKKIYKNYK